MAGGATDVIVVGAGLAGLAATAELADAGRRVILLEQEPGPSLGGQAFWSLGELFLVNSPEERRQGAVLDASGIVRAQPSLRVQVGEFAFDFAGRDCYIRRIWRGTSSVVASSQGTAERAAAEAVA